MSSRSHMHVHTLAHTHAQYTKLNAQRHKASATSAAASASCDHILSSHNAKPPEGKSSLVSAGFGPANRFNVPPPRHTHLTRDMSSARACFFLIYFPRALFFYRIHIHMSLGQISIGFARFEYFGADLSSKGYLPIFHASSPVFWSTTSMQTYAFMAPQRPAKSIWHHHRYFWPKARLGLVRWPGVL